MKKPFKETAVGQFIINKVPQVAQAVGDLLPNQGVLGIVKNIISNTNLTNEDKKACLEQLHQYELELIKLEQQDRADARDMQKEALRQNDVFSKRFIYFLTGFLVVFCSMYILLVSFTTVPKENQPFIQYISGSLITGVIFTVLNFFFGSSLGSKQKEAQLQKSQYE